MKLLKFLPFIALVSCHAEALPDTNIQIQHYDGPVYLGTPSPNCCPFCNSILKPQTIDNGNETPCSPTPQIMYPSVYGNTCDNIPDTPCEITISVEPTEATVSFENNPADGKNSKSERSFGSEISGNYGSMLYTNSRKSVHNVPMTCTHTHGTYGNTYTGGIGNTRSPYGTTFPMATDCACVNPLSNYLPINTASQNTCYQVPTLTCSNSDEPALVPQKFMYSFILDGDVASNQNACDSKLYYY